MSVQIILAKARVILAKACVIKRQILQGARFAALWYAVAWFHHEAERDDQPVKRKAISAAVAALVLASLPTARAAAADAPAGGYLPVTITEQRVMEYVVDGDQVLYTVEDGRRLLLHNLADSTSRQLATDGPIQFLSLSGNRAAYGAFPGGGDLWLMLHDLKSDQPTQVERRPMAFVSVQGDLLAWAKPGTLQPPPDQADGGTRDHPITLYNLATKSRTEVAREVDSLLYGNPIRFDGRYLFWTEVQGDVRQDATMTSTLVAVDLTTGNRQEKVLQGPARTSCIDAGHLFYTTWNRTDKTARLNRWDVASGTTEPVELTGLGAGPVSCSVKGNRLAWLTQGPGSAGDLYTMDLTTRAVEPLTTDGTPKFRVELGAGHAVYNTPKGLYAVPLAPEERKAAPQFHTVQPGETIWKVAQRYGLPMRDLIRANNLLTPDWIFPGERLYLPAPASPRYETHVLKSGETVAQVAAAYKSTLSSLSQLNSLTVEGWHKLAPGHSLTVARGPESHSEGGREYQTYALMPGDSLWQISVKSGVPLADLLARNPGANARHHQHLDVGERLIIRPW